MRTVFKACFVAGLMSPVWVMASQDLSAPGAFQAGWMDVTVNRPAGSSFTAKLFYPAVSSGQNAPYDGTSAPYAGISFGHGFLQTVEKYQSTLDHLATWGYFVIASRSGGELLPNHQAFADDLRHCLTYLEQGNLDNGSWLYGQVQTARFGMSGHSMGGGASLLATAADSRVRTVANLAAADTNPSAIDAAGLLAVPVCLITGSEDTIVPPQNHGQLMYNAAPPPRQLPLIVGGYHCGFIDSNSIFCDSGSISRAAQLAITRRLLTGWFNLYLKSDQTVWPLVWGEPVLADPAVSTTLDSGIVLTSSPDAFVGVRGSELTGTLTIHNAGQRASRYSAFVEDNQWPVAIMPNQTSLLGPGQAETVNLSLTVPADAASVFDQPLVSVRCGADEATRAFVRLRVDLTTAADFDRDCDVDLADFQAFEECASGPAIPLASSCQFADLDADGDVDQSDFGLFQRCYSGEAGIADPYCIQGL